MSARDCEYVRERWGERSENEKRKVVIVYSDGHDVLLVGPRLRHPVRLGGAAAGSGSGAANLISAYSAWRAKLEAAPRRRRTRWYSRTRTRLVRHSARRDAAAAFFAGKGERRAAHNLLRVLPICGRLTAKGAELRVRLASQSQLRLRYFY